MGFGVWGLGVGGLGVWGLGFGVWGLGFGVWGVGCGVWGLGFGVWGLGFWVSAGFKAEGFEALSGSGSTGLRDFKKKQPRTWSLRAPRLQGKHTTPGFLRVSRESLRPYFTGVYHVNKGEGWAVE